MDKFPFKEMEELKVKLAATENRLLKAESWLRKECELGDTELAAIYCSPPVAIPVPANALGRDRWHRHFLSLALVHANMSKDPSTIVGAVVVGPDREVRATGFNGFPRGIADTAERLADRETKLKLVVHAECNAICNAARVGVSLKGCTLYLAASDKSGSVWGGAPCTRCSVHVIQAGIIRVVTYPPKQVPSRWHEDIAAAQEILREAGIEYVEIGGKSTAEMSRASENSSMGEGRDNGGLLP